MLKDKFIVPKLVLNVWDTEMIWISGLTAALTNLFKKQIFLALVTDIQPQVITD